MMHDDYNDCDKYVVGNESDDGLPPIYKEDRL